MYFNVYSIHIDWIDPPTSSSDWAKRKRSDMTSVSGVRKGWRFERAAYVACNKTKGVQKDWLNDYKPSSHTWRHWHTYCFFCCFFCLVACAGGHLVVATPLFM